MIQLDNGTYLIVYEVRGSSLEYTYSRDGFNWTKGQKLSSNWNYWQTDPFLIQWEDDRIMVVFDTTYGSSNGNLLVSFSNNFINWSLPETAYFETEPGIYTHIRSLSKIKDGSILSVSSGGNHKTSIHRTLDGINWTLFSTAKGWFNSIIQTLDGSFYAIGEYSDGKDHWYFSIDGKSWKTKSELEIYLHPIIIEGSNKQLYIAGTFNTASSDAIPPPDLVIFVKNENDKWSIPIKVIYNADHHTDICFFETKDGSFSLSFIRNGLEIIYFDHDQLEIEYK
jgi:hypothetical protein